MRRNQGGAQRGYNLGGGVMGLVFTKLANQGIQTECGRVVQSVAVKPVAVQS